MKIPTACLPLLAADMHLEIRIHDRLAGFFGERHSRGVRLHNGRRYGLVADTVQLGQQQIRAGIDKRPCPDGDIVLGGCPLRTSANIRSCSCR